MKIKFQKIHPDFAFLFVPVHVILISQKRRFVMKTSGILLVCAALAALMVVSGCESMKGHEGAAVGAGAGAVGGAAIGAAAAGSGNRGTGALIGGAAGAALGGIAGDQLHDKKNR